MSNEEEKLEQTEAAVENENDVVEEAHEEFEDAAREKGERKQRSRRKRVETTEEKPVAQNNTVKSETPKEEKQNNWLFGA